MTSNKDWVILHEKLINITLICILIFFFDRLQKAVDDPLTIDKFRLSRYKAVSNPAYICYNSHDPFLEAFRLSDDLVQAAAYDREFYVAYKNLAQVNKLAVPIRFLHCQQSIIFFFISNSLRNSRESPSSLPT